MTPGSSSSDRYVPEINEGHLLPEVSDVQPSAAGFSGSESKPGSSEDLPVLSEVIESLGFGPAQVRAGLLGGGTYFADGAELLLIASVTNSVGKAWDLQPGQRGLVVTIVFIGILVGNLFSGPIGDSYGRRILILSSFAGIFVFSIVSSLSLGVTTLCITRFFVGLSFGIGQPAWNTLGAEVTPARWRIVMQAISQSFFIFGEVYSCMLLLADDPNLNDLRWRWLLQMGAIPSAVFGLAAYFLLKPSPTFLAATGKKNEAMDVLKSMRYDNAICCAGQRAKVPLDFQLAKRRSDLPANQRRGSRRLSTPSWRSVLKQFKVVFGPQLWLSTVIVMFCCFVLNFNYYGCLYAFPQVLAAEESGGDGGAAMELLIGAFWELPGQALGIVAGLYMQRKLNIKLYLLLTFISLLCFTLGLTLRTKGHEVFMLIGYYGIKCFVDSGFVVVYQYSIEIYPTDVRTTGSAIAIGSGRLAGIVSPLVFETLHASTKGYGAFFYILIGFTVFNFTIINFLKYDRFGQRMPDTVDDLDEEEDRDEASAPSWLRQLCATVGWSSCLETQPLLNPQASVLHPEPLPPGR